MANVLVFLGQQGGKLPKATLATISAARELCGTWGKSGLVGLALGNGASNAADASLGFGFARLLYSEQPEFERFLAPTFALALVQAAAHAQCDTVVLPATSQGKDCSARAAALLGAAQGSEIVAVNSDGSLTRPTYAGNVIAKVQLTTSVRVVTVRGTAFAPATPAQAAGVKEAFTVDLSTSPPGEVVGYEGAKSERPELSDAEVVVSGGRALQSSDKFMQYIAPLADAFGGAIGASRAAVDSGYAPNDWQVGQTGKVVAPGLYVAVGISGAIQHLAGMKDSRVIVAINKDADAPIFEVADFGLVADLFDAVPKLTAEVKRVKGGG